MEIDSSTLKFQLTLVSLESLKPHEEIVESSARSIARGIQREGGIRDPLMVDQVDYVILDGMHRFNALRLLNCRFAPCCLLDYESDQIKVGAWYRLFSIHNPNRVARELLAENHLPYSEQQIALTDANYPSNAIIVTAGGSAFLLSGNTDSLQRAKICVELEKQLVKKNNRVDYRSEETAARRLKSGEVSLVISPPVFSKEEIRTFGLQGQLLPHKVTRHIIPSRPLHLNVPLSLLMNRNLQLTEAEMKLDELLRRKTRVVKSPGSVVDGRRYDEELVVFS